MKKAFTPSLLLALLAFGAQAQAANLQNGDFALGLNGWQAVGDASVQTGNVLGLSLGLTPALVLGTASIDFDDDAPAAAGAFNVSGQAAALAGDLEAVLGLPATQLGTNGFEGSGATQTFLVSAGDTITFNWRLLARHHTFLGTESDTAHYFVQTGGNLQAFTLGELASLPLQNLGNGWLDSGMQQVSYTAQDTGLLTLGFAAVDVNSFNGSSLLAVQNVAVTAVPEPEGLALALVGLLLLARAGSRRVTNAG